MIIIKETYLTLWYYAQKKFTYLAWDLLQTSTTWCCGRVLRHPQLWYYRRSTSRTVSSSHRSGIPVLPSLWSVRKTHLGLGLTLCTQPQEWSTDVSIGSSSCILWWCTLYGHLYLILYCFMVYHNLPPNILLTCILESCVDWILFHLLIISIRINTKICFTFSGSVVTTVWKGQG